MTDKLRGKYFKYSGSYGPDMPQMPIKSYSEGLSFIRNGGMVTIRLDDKLVTVSMEQEFALMHEHLMGI